MYAPSFITGKTPYCVGFTGTRRGMTASQSLVFSDLINRIPMSEFHHGDCKGADYQAASMVYNRVPSCEVHSHPPTDSTHRGFLKLCHHESLPATYLVRNRDIVNASDIFIAMILGPENLRSGTWATIRYARKAGKPIIIVSPTGNITGEVKPERKGDCRDPFAGCWSIVNQNANSTTADADYCRRPTLLGTRYCERHQGYYKLG